MLTVPATPHPHGQGWPSFHRVISDSQSPVSPVQPDVERAFTSGESKCIDIPRWPQQPQTLHRGGIVAALSCIGDIILVFISVVFFVYAGVLLKYDGVPTALIPYKSMLDDAARYGPTVFPILFAAIVGQAMQSIALWRLERGERLGVLDQLFGSTAIFATVTTQLKLRAVGPVAISLITLWSLSPLGGQASLRILSYATAVSSSTASLQYLDMNSSFLEPDISEMWKEPTSTTVENLQGFLFGASLISPASVKDSTMDSWGNLKIPMIESLNGTAVDGWLPVESNNSVYSSLIGVPVSPVSTEDNTTFTLETSYWTLDCPILEEGSLQSKLNITGPDWASVERRSWSFGTPQVNMMTPEGRARMYGQDPNMPVRKLYYNSADGGAAKGRMTYAECEMRTSYVEVQASCQASNCAVVAMRNSTLPHLLSKWTFLEKSWHTTREFVHTFHGSVAANEYEPSVMQRYFINPGSPVSVSNAPPLYTVGQKSFAISLAQLMNSFWIAGIGPRVVTGDIPSSGGEVWNGTRLLQAGNVTVSHAEEILVCDKRWLAALLVSTSAMFISGVVGLTLGFLRRGPDLAMDIATMTRDNPYMNLPPGGSALDCAERSRLLRNVRVRFGDVAPHGEVGYAAVGSLMEEKEVEMLKVKRLYA